MALCSTQLLVRPYVSMRETSVSFTLKEDPSFFPATQPSKMARVWSAPVTSSGVVSMRIMNLLAPGFCSAFRTRLNFQARQRSKTGWSARLISDRRASAARLIESVAGVRFDEDDDKDEDEDDDDKDDANDVEDEDNDEMSTSTRFKQAQ